jgi:hypothetical protein
MTMSAGPPRRVGAAVKELREAMQAALTSRCSRLAVRLPDGARLGLEKGVAEGAAAFVRGDREMARCIAAMFDGTGLQTCVVFPAASEMLAGIKSFGPTTECQFDCWEDGSTGRAAGGGSGGRGRRKKGGPAPASSAGAGFGTQVPAEVVSPGVVMAARRADVYVIVGPKQSQMARVRQLCESFGDEVLVILANGRAEAMRGLPVATERYLARNFEDVYYWGVDPSPSFAGGVLFRKFPNEWILGRASPLGTLQKMLVSPERPSVDEITARLKAEAEKPATGLLNNVASFFDGRA